MTGLLPPEPQGGPVAPGTSDQPWRLSAEWSFQSETRMAARGFFFQTLEARSEGQMATEPFGFYNNLSTTYAFDIAPMYVTAANIGASHGITLFLRAGGALALDKTLFKVEPIIGQVSEATWHFFPDFKPPAAANTLPVLTGIRIYGIAGLQGQSAVVPIAKLRDASNPRPLPFARRTPNNIAGLIAAGIAADAFSALSAAVGSQALLLAYSRVLSGGDGIFATLRTEAGLPHRGSRLWPCTRSNQPFVAAAAGAAVVRTVHEPGGSAGAGHCRARRSADARAAVKSPAAGRNPAAGGAHGARAPVLRTTVTKLASAVQIPRVSVDRDLRRGSAIPGARLALQSRAGAAQPTRVARSVQTVRHADLGAVIPRATASAMAQIEAASIGKGATIRAGVTHIWELGARRVTAIQISSDMPVRVVFLSAAGTLLADVEYANARQLRLETPPGCGMVALTGLGAAGAVADNMPGGTAGAVTRVLAPPGSAAHRRLAGRRACRPRPGPTCCWRAAPSSCSHSSPASLSTIRR